MENIFQKPKELISKFLTEYLTQKSRELKEINQWGKDVCQKLLALSLGGKMIRGSLVLTSYHFFKKELNEEVIKTAAALELFQTSILIHDDIIDHDMLRRGQPTVQFHFEKFAKNQNLTNPIDFGKSFAICIGDIGYFLTFELLSEFDLGSKIKDQILSTISREMTIVGLGEMQDIYLANNRQIPKEKEIMNCYLYKTTRYSFSLPLMLGAISAGQSKKTIKLFDLLGQKIGIIFQIKDDELGLFGNSQVSGKPVGKDIIEGKKTLYYLYLYKRSNSIEKNKLDQLFGNKNLKPEEIEYILNLINKYRIQDRIDNKVSILQKKVDDMITKLPIPKEKQQILNYLVEFIIERKK